MMITGLLYPKNGRFCDYSLLLLHSKNENDKSRIINTHKFIYLFCLIKNLKI
jgi:hypothetical protein